MVDCVEVSILISYYNQKEYVRDSIESVINQKTSFDYEIICGDDGSTDGTYEELLLWKQKYPSMIQVYQMPREQGKQYEPIIRASNNRYNMLKYANGKYITILDGDDYYCDDTKLQKQFDILEQHPECVACCHSMKYVWDDGSKPDEPLGLIANKSYIISNRDYWASVWLPAEAFLFRNYYKNSLDEINKDFFDDNLITIYFVKKGNIVYIPDCMVVYRQTGESSWNSRNEIQKIYVNALGYQESKKILNDMKRECFYRYQGIYSQLYDNRNADFCVGGNKDFIVSDSIYVDTIKYKDATRLYKIKYIMKYFLPAHMGLVPKVIRKLNRLKWKRI